MIDIFSFRELDPLLVPVHHTGPLYCSSYLRVLYLRPPGAVPGYLRMYELDTTRTPNQSYHGSTRRKRSYFQIYGVPRDAAATTTIDRFDIDA